MNISFIFGLNHQLKIIVSTYSSLCRLINIRMMMGQMSKIYNNNYNRDPEYSNREITPDVPTFVQTNEIISMNSTRCYSTITTSTIKTKLYLEK